MLGVLLLRNTVLRQTRTPAPVAKLGNPSLILGQRRAKNGWQKTAQEGQTSFVGCASIVSIRHASSATQKTGLSLLCRTMRSWMVGIIASRIAIHRAVFVASRARAQGVSIDSKLTPATIAEGT